MKNPLYDFLKSQILQYGLMDVGQYMSIVLGHPEHGYYIKKDPFGKDGDFTTSPEISQMFGEMLGVWAAHLWMQIGSPERFILLECGSGRGTLMSDIMRATAHVKGFHEACNIHLLEISPVLKEKQAQELEQYKVFWHDNLVSVPDDVPLIVIGNEFLDVLPVRQLVKVSSGWCERVVVYTENNGFHWGVVEAVPLLLGFLPDDLVDVPDGSVFEVSLSRILFIQNLCSLIKKSGGGALFIDYGHEHSGCGDTFQALYDHEYVSVFEHIGSADLTSHVDFEQISNIVSSEGLVLWELIHQGAFLEGLGISARAAYLQTKADNSQKKDIEKALHRLTHPDEMGKLFKVISFGEILHNETA